MTRAQTLIISFLLLFGLVLLVFPLIISQFNNESTVDIKELQKEATNINQLLNAPPFPKEAPPESWTRPGLIKDGAITTDILVDFASIDYYETKKQLGAKFDYIVYLTLDGDVVTISGDGFTWEYFGYGGEPNGGSDLDVFIELLKVNSRFIAKEESFGTFLVDGQLIPVEVVVLSFDSGGLGPLDWLLIPDYDFYAQLYTTKINYLANERINLTGDIWQ